MKSPIVSSKWLFENKDLNELIILDSSPTSTVGGKVSEFPDTFIPGARLFDIEGDFSKKDSPFPNTLPTPEDFQSGCRKLGINNDSIIVIYDNLGVYTSPRVWWMFKAMGHEDVFVLDGGLPDWLKEGYPTERSTELSATSGNFVSAFRPSYVLSYEQIVANSDEPLFTIVDARSKGRFDGTSPEPRKGLKSGHIPYSVNLPFQEVLNQGKFKSPEEIRKLFGTLDLQHDQLVFSCGSGLTACIILLACEIGFKSQPYVYDGSWTEWAELQELKEN